MNKSVRKAKLFLKICIFLITVSSFMIMLVPFADYSGNTFKRVLTITICILFWGCLLSGYVIFFLTNKMRLDIRKRYRQQRMRHYRLRYGALNFFKNTEAMFFDAVLIASAIVLILLLIMKVQNDWLLAAVITLFIYSFQMHCILNGKIYIDIRLFKCEERKTS